MANLNLRGEAFRLNKVTTAGEQTDVQITALKNGAFIAVWTDSSATGDDASGRAIRGRLFDADGNPLGEERVLNTSTAGNQSEPTVAALDDGRFVVAWTDRSGSADPDIRAQIFEADGQKRGSEILVNNGVAGKQSIASVTALAGGGFAVTYGQMSGSSEYDVRTRSFINTQTGLEISDDVIVPQNPSGQQWSPQIVGLSDGYAVVHTDQFGAPVKGRFFSNGGVPGATFDVPSGNAQIALAALEGPDGTKDRFLMTWTSYANNGLNTPTGIRALIVDKFGNKTEIGNDGTAGDGFLIAAGAVSFSAVTALPGGGSRSPTCSTRAASTSPLSTARGSASSRPTGPISSSATMRPMERTSGPRSRLSAGSWSSPGPRRPMTAPPAPRPAMSTRSSSR